MRPGAGVVVVEPGEELAFLHPLPVQALWGVGPATLARLQRLGVVTVGDLAALPEAGPRRHASGRPTAATSTGWPTASTTGPVEPDRPLKSVGHEQTFARRPRTTAASSSREVVRMADAVGAAAAARAAWPVAPSR